VEKQQMYVCIPALVIRHASRIFSVPHHNVICGLTGYTTFVYIGVSQPPGRGPVPGPGINYTGPREVNIL
jgi:hypothetical protein